MKKMIDPERIEGLTKPVRGTIEDDGTPSTYVDEYNWFFNPDDSLLDQLRKPDDNTRLVDELNSFNGNVYARTLNSVTMNVGNELKFHSTTNKDWTEYGRPSISPYFLGRDANRISGIAFRCARNGGNSSALWAMTYNGLTFDNKSVVRANSYKVHHLAILGATESAVPLKLFANITTTLVSSSDGKFRTKANVNDYLSNQCNNNCQISGVYDGKAVMAIYNKKLLFADGTFSEQNWDALPGITTYTIQDTTETGL